MNIDLFSKNLKEKRIEAGYTQTELSELLYITRSSYNHYETGIRMPTIPTLIEMSSLFNISPMELLLPLLSEGTEIKSKPSSRKEDAEFITNYNKLNEAEKHTINNLINILNSTHSANIK